MNEAWNGTTGATPFAYSPRAPPRSYSAFSPPRRHVHTPRSSPYVRTPRSHGGFRYPLQHLNSPHSHGRPFHYGEEGYYEEEEAEYDNMASFNFNQMRIGDPPEEESEIDKLYRRLEEKRLASASFFENLNAGIKSEEDILSDANLGRFGDMVNPNSRVFEERLQATANERSHQARQELLVEEVRHFIIQCLYGLLCICKVCSKCSCMLSLCSMRSEPILNA